jgi:hypothetical protein
MELLDHFWWDWRALRDQLQRPVDRPFQVDRPGGWQISPYDLPPEERETVLLTLLAAGRATPLYLLAYFTVPDATVAPS